LPRLFQRRCKSSEVFFTCKYFVHIFFSFFCSQTRCTPLVGEF
jgi:hypothetical protein